MEGFTDRKIPMGVYHKLGALNRAHAYLTALSVAFLASIMLLGLWVNSLKATHAIQVRKSRRLT